MSAVPLQFSPWVPKKIPPFHKNIPSHRYLFGHTLTKHSKFSTPLSPLNPLQNNPDFPPGAGNHLLRPVDSKMPLLAVHCFTNKTMKDFTQFKIDKMPHMPPWSYFQVRSYVNNTTRKGYFVRDLTEFETVCFNGEQVPKSYPMCCCKT